MIIFLIMASLVSSMVISDISQINRCKREKSETEYCKEKTTERLPAFGSEN